MCSKKLLSSLDQFVNELPNKENSTSADQEDKRMDLAKDIKGVVDGYKDELNIESVKLEIKVE